MRQKNKKKQLKTQKLQSLYLGEDSRVCTTDDEDSGLDSVSEDDFYRLSPQDCDNF